ncbi:unnamed protein product, partial [Linum tenue]
RSRGGQGPGSDSGELLCPPLLPPKTVSQLCILSNRFYSAWNSTPSLSFHHSDAGRGGVGQEEEKRERFIDYISSTLARRAPSFTLDEFRIQAPALALPSSPAYHDDRVAASLPLLNPPRQSSPPKTTATSPPLSPSLTHLVASYSRQHRSRRLLSRPTSSPPSRRLAVNLRRRRVSSVLPLNLNSIYRYQS